MLVNILRLINTLISIYMILIFARVVLTWFSGGPDFGQTRQMLSAVTDPYLNYFRRFSILRYGMVDFSPIAGIIVLAIILNILNTIIAHGTISLGIILAIILKALWNAVSFVLTLFTIMTAIRLLADLIKANTVSPFVRTLDIMLAPLLDLIGQKLFRNRPVTYRIGLAVLGACLIAFNIIAGVLIFQITTFFTALPI